jgi:hypothetical protein
MQLRAPGSSASALRLGGGAAALAIGIAGCTSILGMDKPTLSPCFVEDACLDASPASYDARGVLVDAADEDFALPQEDSSSPDAGLSDGSADDWTPPPVLCAASAVGDAAWCSGATPVCCQGSDGGQPTYSCVATDPAGLFANCPSNTYPIACDGPGACASGDVCCHFHTGGMKCVPPSHCGPLTDSIFVCDPDAGPGASGCPSGTSCTDMLTNSGLPTPYHGCQ